MSANCSQSLAPSTGGSITYTTDPGTQTLTASFSCVTGYYLKGPSTKKCLPNSTWESGSPVCVYDNTYVYNDVDIHGAGLPLWLAVCLGVLAGLVGLLLLCCLLYWCLRTCGCLRGSLFGNGTEEDGCTCCYGSRRHGRRRRSYDSDVDSRVYVVSREGKHRNRTKYTHPPRRSQEETSAFSSPPPQHVGGHTGTLEHSKPPTSTLIHHVHVDSPATKVSNRKPNVSYIEYVSATRPTQTSTPVLQKQEVVRHTIEPDPPSKVTPRSNKVTEYVYHSNMASSDSGISTSSPRDVIIKEKKRQKAKHLAAWMPHSHPIRPINTSTK